MKADHPFLFSKVACRSLNLSPNNQPWERADGGLVHCLARDHVGGEVKPGSEGAVHSVSGK